jgi:hypothetical protein
LFASSPHRTRRAPAVIAIAAALAVAAPATASAAGWRLPVLNNHLGAFTTHTTAKHCGGTKFGTWSFHSSMKAEGAVAIMVWKTRVTKDGAPHPVAGLRVTGTAPDTAKQQLRDVFAQLKFHYVAGSSPKLVSVAADGSVFSTRALKPRRVKRCLPGRGGGPASPVR